MMADAVNADKSFNTLSPPKKRVSRHFTVTEKESILNIFKSFEQSNPGYTKTEKVKFTAEAAGVGIASVYNILREYKSTRVFKPPKVYHRKRAILDQIDEETRKAVRNVIHSFSIRNEPPTVRKILSTLEEKEDMPNFKKSTFKILLKELGFRYTKRKRNDGKFILELERAREGERVSWVSVPRKTFWPPPGTATSTPAYRQESSTSLSVSDDNSSIQSSPWQRDHSWKQTTPRRNISQEMVLFFWRPKRRRRLFRGRGVKRRRPLSMVEVKDDDRDTVKVKKEKRKKRPLLSIVQSLLDKNFRTSTPPRPETVVSPRKRFLREMERERTPSASSSPTSDRPGSSDDGASNSAQKRSRVRPQSTTGPPTPRTPPYPAVKIEKSENLTPPPLSAPIRSNGVEDTPVNTTKSSKNCSYSITSLLAEDHHKSSLKSSPSHSPSRFSPVVAQVGPIPPPGSRYCSPITSEDRLYSESVDRLRSIELSQVEKCGYPPTYPHPSQPYLGPSPYMYPFPSLPPYYGPGVYGRARYMVPQPVYHPHPAHPHAPSPHSIHPVHPVAHPVPIRRDVARPTPWGREEVVRGSRMDLREESVADMPLNLSKHSG